MSRLHLPIQNPCNEDWSAMAIDGARRFCGVCTKHVHDLSAMTEPSAIAVLADESVNGPVCVRYSLDPDGQIEFMPETIEAPNLWRMTLVAAGLAMALMTGCTDPRPDQVNRDECVYEFGPWTVTTARGEGSCPSAEPKSEHVVTDMPAPVEIETPCEPAQEPVQQIQGGVSPQPRPVKRMGKPKLPDKVVEPTMGEAPF